MKTSITAFVPFENILEQKKFSKNLKRQLFWI